MLSDRQGERERSSTGAGSCCWDCREDRGGTKQRRHQQAGGQRGIHHNVDPTEQEQPRTSTERHLNTCPGCSGEHKRGRVCVCFPPGEKWRSWRAAVCAPQWAFCPAESWLGSRSWRRNSRDAGCQAAPASSRRICSDTSAVSTPLSSPTTAGNGWCLVSWQIPLFPCVRLF